jgi:hypothetical protein
MFDYFNAQLQLVSLLSVGVGLAFLFAYRFAWLRQRLQTLPLATYLPEQKPMWGIKGDRTHVRSLGVIRHATMRSFGATSVQLKRGKNRAFSRKRRQGNGLEFLPSWFAARGSIQLSYGRTVMKV